MSNYWNKTLEARVGRRRLLATSGAGALGAAFLAACGGDDDSNGSGGGSGDSGSSGLVTNVEDTSSKAKNGGTWVNPLTSENFLNMDPYGVAVGSAHAPW